MKLEQIFKKCQELTLSKRHDYTTHPEIDNHENFKRSSEIAAWFTSPDDKSYAVLIGTKLARLASLLSTGKTPKNESIEDSFIDLINYCALWAERRLSSQATNKLEPGMIIPVASESRNLILVSEVINKTAFLNDIELSKNMSDYLHELIKSRTRKY